MNNFLENEKKPKISKKAYKNQMITEVDHEKYDID